MAEKCPPRQVFAERLDDLLVVAFPRSGHGSQTMTVFDAAGFSGVASGRATTAPTRIGTPIACAAMLICSAASALANGSMSEEFSGQTTNCGCGAVRRLHVLGQLQGLADMVVQHRAPLALKSRPSLGTLPWMAATVTVGSSRAARRLRRTPGGQRGGQQHHADTARRAAHARGGAVARPIARAPSVTISSASAHADVAEQRDGERQQRRPRPAEPAPGKVRWSG